MDTGRKYKLLIVDDQEMVRKSTGRHFRGSYDMQFASSGNEAISLLYGGYTPDVCICDVSMANGTGKDVYEAAAADFRERIIFVTGGGGFREDLDEFIRQRRADDHVIDKPFDPRELKWLVAEILVERRKLKP